MINFIKKDNQQKTRIKVLMRYVVDIECAIILKMQVEIDYYLVNNLIEIITAKIL